MNRADEPYDLLQPLFCYTQKFPNDLTLKQRIKKNLTAKNVVVPKIVQTIQKSDEVWSFLKKLCIINHASIFFYFNATQLSNPAALILGKISMEI